MRGRTRTFHSKKYSQKKRKRLLAVIGIWAGCLLVVFIAIVCFMRYDSLLIHEVQVTGNRAVSAEEIRVMVEDHLDRSRLGLFPNRNFFLYPSAEIVSDISEKIPRIDTIRLVRHGDILSAEIVERVPFAVVCRPTTPGSPAEACFMTDDTAFVYADAAAPSSSIYIVIDIPETFPAVSGEIAVGKKFMELKPFRSLLELQDGVTKLGHPVVRMTLKSDGDIEMLTEAGAEIFVRSAPDYEPVLTNLMLFIEKSKQQITSKKATTSKMTRIDLRYGNSVFYK